VPATWRRRAPAMARIVRPMASSHRPCCAARCTAPATAPLVR